MDFVKAQKFVARVSEKYYLTDSHTFLFVKFELIDPDRMSFFAGQYLSLKVSASGERRCYSIVSTPDNNHGFDLLAEIIPTGKGSEYLTRLQPGDTVEVIAPLGRFVVDTYPTAQKLLFVATGSGIAPIASMITDLLVVHRDTRPLRLTWGMRSEESLFWFDNFERLAEAHPNFVFDPVLSRPSESWHLCTGHVQDCIQRDFTPARIRDWDVFVCGSPAMVEDVVELTRTMGVPVDHLHHEKFS